MVAPDLSDRRQRGRASRPRRSDGVRAVVLAAFAVLVAVLGAAPPGGTALAQGASQGQARAILPLRPPQAGTFSLVDHTARTVTDKDFQGRFMLVYFGYTYCPDVCPTGLQAMSDAIDMLGAAGRHVQPVFITVDPERDTVTALADYVEAFHPRLLGLTGTAARIKAAAKAYGVRYFKLYYPDSDEDNADYAVHHTAFTYLIGPDGRGLKVFPHGVWPEDMARDIRHFIENGA